MRHHKAGNRLSRNSTLRKATMRDLARATLIRQRICTTKAKAKEARKLIDRLITLGKKRTLSARRKAFSILCDHQLVSQLFNNIASRFNLRNGGYTRIISLSHRRGDNAQLVFLELTEKDKVIISKTRTGAQAKSQERDIAVVDKKAISEAKPETKSETRPAAEQPKKERTPQSEPTKIHPKKEKKDILSQEKPKIRPNIISGIKKMFTKRPQSGS